MDDLTEMEMRISRLEMHVIGVQLSQLETSSSSSSPIKSMTSLKPVNDNNDRDVLDTSSTATLKGDDFASRLTVMEQSVASAFSRSSVQRAAIDQLESHWKDIHRYLDDLDPGTALTHQQQIAAPLLYRRQEVLASAEELKHWMKQVSEILHLLLIGQSLPDTTKHISEMHVSKAPILVNTTIVLSTEQQNELLLLEQTFTDLAERVNAAGAKLDRLLVGYQQLITSVSEKLVFLDEELSAKK